MYNTIFSVLCFYCITDAIIISLLKRINFLAADTFQV